MNRFRFAAIVCSLVALSVISIAAHAQTKPMTPMPRVAPATAPAYMQIFIGANAVAGSSTAAGYQGWIAVDSFNNTPPSSRASSSGAGASKVTPGWLIITKSVDRASAALSKASSDGEHLSKVVLIEMNHGKGVEKWTLEDVMISSFTVGSGGNTPKETIKFTYTKIITTAM